MKHRKTNTKYCSYCGSRIDRWYSPESAAKLLDCSVEKVRKMIRKREIGYCKMGRLVRIPESELREIGQYFPSINDLLDKPNNGPVAQQE